MTNSLAGINLDPAIPGFSHFIIRPYFVKELDRAKGEYLSVNGMIRSEWKREGKKIHLTVTVPANTTATIYADKIYNVVSGIHYYTF
jgi:alpha-L-rhamnosidase